MNAATEVRRIDWSKEFTPEQLAQIDAESDAAVERRDALRQKRDDYIDKLCKLRAEHPPVEEALYLIQMIRAADGAASLAVGHAPPSLDSTMERADVVRPANVRYAMEKFKTLGGN